MLSPAGIFFNFEIRSLSAQSARTPSLQLRREHHSAILNKEGKEDVVYETRYMVGCLKRHARVGGASFCPPPVGEILENVFSHNFSLGMVLMWVSCRGDRFLQFSNIQPSDLGQKDLPSCVQCSPSAIAKAIGRGCSRVCTIDVH